MIPFNQISASLIQTAARRLLLLDPESKGKLAQFENKLIHLYVEDLDIEYFFSFKNGDVSVSNSSESEVSTSIRGQLKSFIGAAANEHSSDAIFKGELHFTGEINTAKQFQQFVQSLNIDWHEPLAQLLGDPIGHTIASGLESFGGWLSTTIKSTRSDIGEYLQEEIRVTPSRYEQQAFFERVDQIRSRSDRLNARVNRLKTKLSPFPTDNA